MLVLEPYGQHVELEPNKEV